MTITIDNFHSVTKFIEEKTGMVLDDSKSYFVESRLNAICEDRGFDNIGELMSVLVQRPYSDLADDVTDQLMVNETYFFRDSAPFKVFQNVVLPEVMSRKGEEKEFRMWCAASSSGQEPYSVCMLIKQHFPSLSNWKIHFDATDVSLKMVERCKQGAYSDVELRRGLPDDLKQRFFKQQGTKWQLSHEITSMVKFSQLNLVRPWPRLPKPDIVFIRNVLIYFDQDTKKRIFGELVRLLGPGGYFFVGGGEIPSSLGNTVEPLGAGAYRVK